MSLSICVLECKMKQTRVIDLRCYSGCLVSTELPLSLAKCCSFFACVRSTTQSSSSSTRRRLTCCAWLNLTSLGGEQLINLHHSEVNSRLTIEVAPENFSISI